jgi:hypothetical protein
MGSYFDIDYDELVRLLLPVRLRQVVMRAWLACLVQPVKELYVRFCSNRNANLYVLHHNSQVVYLQATLNDIFDPTLRRIYITDGSNADPLYVYLPAENLPLWLGLRSEAGTVTYPVPQWLYTPAEIATSVFAFIVWLPAGLTYDPDRMRALIDRYRLVSKPHYGILMV